MTTKGNTPEAASKPQTKCQQQIGQIVDEFRDAVRAAASLTPATSADERTSVEANICLASRSAYLDFYTWIVLNKVIDGPAAADMDRLFKEALNIMGPGRYKESVADRYREFKEECARTSPGTSRELVGA